MELLVKDCTAKGCSARRANLISWLKKTNENASAFITCGTTFQDNLCGGVVKTVCSSLKVIRFLSNKASARKYAVACSSAANVINVFTGDTNIVAVVSLGRKDWNKCIKHNTLLTQKRLTGIKTTAGKFILYPKRLSLAKSSYVTFHTRSNRMRCSTTSKVSIDKMFTSSFAFTFHLLSWTLIDCRSRLGPLTPSVLVGLLPKWSVHAEPQEFKTATQGLCSYHHWP